MSEKKLSFSDNVEISGGNGSKSSSPRGNGASSQKKRRSPTMTPHSPSTNSVEGYFVSSHTGGSSTNLKAISNLKRYEDDPYFRHRRPAGSPVSPSRTPTSTYAPVRTPSSSQLDEKRPSGRERGAEQDRETHAQYLVQERAYLQKIKNDLKDDYYARGLSSISSESLGDQFESEEDDDSVSDLNESLGFGGVGTSFDDEYMEMGSSYPFLEAGYSLDDLDDPENFRERLEWQAMLSSVLTGEVVRSEKRRIRGPVENQMQEDDLWIAIRAKVCGRALSEQKRVLDYARANADQCFEEFNNFKISYPSGEADLDSAIDQVNTMLDKIEKCESLWRSKKTMREVHKLYGTDMFQRRLDAVISWLNITDAINKQLNALRVWTGNSELDPTRTLENPRSDTMMEETQSLVESVLKQDNLTDIFDLRIHQAIIPLVDKAREATIEYSQVFVELGLPLFHERLSDIMAFPVKLIQEIIRMRLSYAKKLVNPTMLVVDQVLSDFQLYIKIGLDTLEGKRPYTEPIFDKGWVFQTQADEAFNETVLDCVRFHLHLLHTKFLDGLKSYRSYQVFKETEQLEQQYNFLQSIGRLINGSDIIVAEQFSSLESKLLSRLLNYWEMQTRSVNLKSKSEVERWLSITIENVRSFQRKLLRFHKILTSEYENSTEVTIQQSRVKPFVESLRNSGHFLVYTGAFEKYGIYAIADPTLAKQPDKIKSILLGYSRYEPPEDDELQPAISYVMVFCIQEPLVWEGEIVNIEVPFFDMEIKQGRMRLISQGKISELARARSDLARVTGGNDAFEVSEETRSHLTKVHHELVRIRKLFSRLSSSVLTYACVFRNKCIKTDYQESVQNMFVFAREFGQRGINAMEVGRRGNVAMKLINLCVEWVSFICDDCPPTDYKTFRWTVVALEFAMVMTRGVNIMAISDDQFLRLRQKVAGCMALLISHFDIMGARSKAAEQMKALEASRRNKLLNVQFKDDDDLMAAFREEALKKLNQLEDAREQNRLVGKVLDDSNTDTEFLSFVASSFSNMSIRWQQGQFIGGGAFGTVYAAVNLDTGGLMAVKEIRLQDTQSIRHVLKSIKDEMTVLEILNHPNIVQYYGVEVHRDRVFIFMEYCQGGSLAGLLEYGRIEDEQVIQIYALQMLEGLAYLHQSGIVHRDIKPENILLDHMGVVKFVDFGAAKVIAKTGKTRGGGLHNANTKLNSMTGTPMYMSPEVITGTDSGKRGSIDIWSLGCCVLEMATGRRPWANLDNEWAIMYHIAAGHLPQLPSKNQLGELGQNFLMRCLQRDPMKRPTAMELLNDPWIVDIRLAVIEPGPSSEESLSPSSSSATSNAPMDAEGNWLGRPQGWQVPGTASSSLSSHSQHSTQTRQHLRERAIKIHQQYQADQEALSRKDGASQSKFGANTIHAPEVGSDVAVEPRHRLASA